MKWTKCSIPYDFHMVWQSQLTRMDLQSFSKLLCSVSGYCSRSLKLGFIFFWISFVSWMNMDVCGEYFNFYVITRFCRCRNLVSPMRQSIHGLKLPWCAIFPNRQNNNSGSKKYYCHFNLCGATHLFSHRQSINYFSYKLQFSRLPLDLCRVTML